MTDRSPKQTGNRSEEDYLQAAKEYTIVARMDKAKYTGPVFAAGHLSTVKDVNGKEYIDFNSGQMCSWVGHRHPKVVNAIRDAAENLIHASSMFFNVKEISLAERLGQILPPPLKRSLFLESGADSNETAIAMAKRYTGGYEVASPHVSFHGLSDSTRSVTYAGWHKGYGPYAPGAFAIFAPYQYRCPIEEGDCGTLTCLDASFDLLDAETEGQLAAVITEPLFSAGGVIEPPVGWLERLREKTHERGALLIYDEAQTGLGKLGSMWGFQAFGGPAPDILTISKHFGGGVSVSAVCTSDEIADRIQASGFITGHSHQNDPLACSAAMASIDLIVEEDIPHKAQQLGDYWRGLLEELAEKHALIGDIRGRGLLQGVELVLNRETREPAYAIGKEVEGYCVDAGLLFSVRRGGSVLRFVPPVSTSKMQFDQAAEILDQALDVAARSRASARG